LPGGSRGLGDVYKRQPMRKILRFGIPKNRKRIPGKRLFMLSLPVPGIPLSF
jgi:hypothetical protein